jgi:hypothetical protein
MSFPKLDKFSVTVRISHLICEQFIILLNKKSCDLCRLPSTVRIVKSRKLQWAGHVARIGRQGMHIEFWWFLGKSTWKTK